MTLLLLILSVFAFLVAACMDWGVFGMSAEHLLGVVALGLAVPPVLPVSLLVVLLLILFVLILLGVR